MNVSDVLIRRWMLSGSIINAAALTPGTTWTQFLPGNPLRAGVIFSSNSAAGAFWDFSDAMPSSGQGQIVIVNGANAVFFADTDIGDVITMPIWGKASTTGAQQVVSEIVYDQNQYQQFRRVINDILSRAGSS